MASRHTATAMAALNLIATPTHLRASQSMAAAPAAGGAPQGAAPRAAEPGFSWDEVVAAENARNGLGQPQATASIASTSHHTAVAPRASYTSAAVDWDAAVVAVNAENGCTQPGANPDPRLVAIVTGEAAR